MAYIPKGLILKSYSSLSALTEDHKEGQTQIVSAIRHLFALDMFYKENGTDCYYFPSFEEIKKFLLDNCINGDLLITMGAGNVVEIGESLLQK